MLTQGLTDSTWSRLLLPQIGEALKAAPKSWELSGEGRPDTSSWSPESMLREGRGFLKVQLAEEWCWRAVWQQPQDLPQTEQEILPRSWTRACPPFPIGQASILISPGQVIGIGHRDPHPCMDEKVPTMARRASQQKYHWGHLGKGLRDGFWEEPLDMHILLVTQEPRNSGLFLSPLPSYLRLGPWTFWYGNQLSAQHTCPESSCLIRSQP